MMIRPREQSKTPLDVSSLGPFHQQNSADTFYRTRVGTAGIPIELAFLRNVLLCEGAVAEIQKILHV